MSARLLDGRAVAAEIRGEAARETAAFRERTGVTPRLVMILAGEDPASVVYTRNKAKAAEESGIGADLITLPVSVTAAALRSQIASLNADPGVHGILVQLPLPSEIDAAVVTEAIDPVKDVDGVHPVNAGRLAAGRPGFVPCTPAGIMELLRRSGIPVAGREAIVLGRSAIVGRPMAALLTAADATVTVAHSKTQDLESVTRRGEILVAAIGRAAAIGKRHIRPGATVVDVGINRCTSAADAAVYFPGQPERLDEIRRRGHTLVGDVHPAEGAEAAGAITPVPGGIGPLTIAMLLLNTLKAARGLAGERV